MYNPIPSVLYLVGPVLLINANGGTIALILGLASITALFFYCLYYMAGGD